MRRNGFTLIELMISAAMSLVILGVVTFAFSNASGVVKRALAMSDRVDRAQTAARQFDADFASLSTANAGIRPDDPLNSVGPLFAGGGASAQEPHFSWNNANTGRLGMELYFHTRASEEVLRNDYDGEGLRPDRFTNSYGTVAYRVRLEEDPGNGLPRKYARWTLTRQSDQSGLEDVLYSSPWFPLDLAVNKPLEVVPWHPLQVQLAGYSVADSAWRAYPGLLVKADPLAPLPDVSKEQVNGINFLDPAPVPDGVDSDDPLTLTLTWAQAGVAFNPARGGRPEDLYAEVNLAGGGTVLLSPVVYKDWNGLDATQADRDDRDKYMIQDEVRYTQTFRIQPTAPNP